GCAPTLPEGAVRGPRVVSLLRNCAPAERARLRMLFGLRCDVAIPALEQALALGRRAVLGEVVIDELDVGYLRRQERHAWPIAGFSSSCSLPRRWLRRWRKARSTCTAA